MSVTAWGLTGSSPLTVSKYGKVLQHPIQERLYWFKINYSPAELNFLFTWCNSRIHTGPYYSMQTALLGKQISRIAAKPQWEPTDSLGCSHRICGGQGGPSHWMCLCHIVLLHTIRKGLVITELRKVPGESLFSPSFSISVIAVRVWQTGGLNLNSLVKV